MVIAAVVAGAVFEAGPASAHVSAACAGSGYGNTYGFNVNAAGAANPKDWVVDEIDTAFSSSDPQDEASLSRHNNYTATLVNQSGTIAVYVSPDNLQYNKQAPVLLDTTFWHVQRGTDARIEAKPYFDKPGQPDKSCSVPGDQAVIALDGQAAGQCPLCLVHPTEP